MSSPKLPFDVLTGIMCLSALTCADLSSCLTVSHACYSVSICQLVHVISLNNEWDCTFWSNYLQRCPIVAPYVHVLQVNGQSMPFSFILLNNILAVCPNMEWFYDQNLDLNDLHGPVFFIGPMEVKLTACMFSSAGVHAFLAYSDITSLTIVSPSFPTFNNNSPFCYGPPCLMQRLSIICMSISDVIWLFTCVPPTLMLFKTAELDIIHGAMAQPVWNIQLVVPSFSPVVQRMLIHSVCAIILAMCSYSFICRCISTSVHFFDLSNMVFIQWFAYMTCENNPMSTLNMLWSIPRSAPLWCVSLGASLTDQRWRMVPVVLCQFRRMISLSLAYHQLPPNRDMVNICEHVKGVAGFKKDTCHTFSCLRMGWTPPPPPLLPYMEVIYTYWDGLVTQILVTGVMPVCAGVLSIIASWLPYLTLARNMFTVSISQ